MKTDALGRRLRRAPPSPRRKCLQLQESDRLVFDAIARHGPLPIHYLYELIGRCRSYLHFQHRLTELYNGDERGEYLIRPPQQHAGYEARYQHLVYDLGPRAREALELVAPGRRDPFFHQLMQACVGASLEVGCARRCLGYLGRDEILHRAPQSTRAAANPMALPLRGLDRDWLLPDDLFGIQGRDERGTWYRRFAVEIDRNTESIERRNLSQSAFGQKIAGYSQVLSERAYRAHFGISGLSVLIVTTNAGHARNLLDCIDRHAGEFASRFHVKTFSDFGPNWRVPRQVQYELVDEPWMTIAGDKRIDRP